MPGTKQTGRDDYATASKQKSDKRFGGIKKKSYLCTLKVYITIIINK
jgi:hypothetical protein